MEIQQANRTDAEKVFIIVTNVDATTITTGYAVNMRFGTAASFDGAQVVMADSDTAVDLPGFVGVAARDIAVGGAGRVQCWGYADSVYISNVGSSLTITLGDPMVPGKGAGGMFSLAPTYASSGNKFVICGGTITISAAQYTDGFIRAI